MVREVLHRDHRPVHSDSQCRTLADGFSQYFTDKLDRIRQSITASLQQVTEPDYCGRRHTGPTLSQLSSTTANEVKKVLTMTRLKQSPTDVLPTSLLRSSVDVFVTILMYK